MRTAFIEQLIVEARRNPKLFLVVGDLGFSVVEPFAAEFPERFLNAGVAEQNMTGVAAGLASEGYHVFTYSIGNFPTLRCLEQIRNDVCYHNLPVTVVAVGAGMAYGNMGYSHHCVQDIAALRGLPRLTLLSPADPGETRHCVKWLAQNPGPSYLRLGKAGEPTVHSLLPNFTDPLCIVDQNGQLAIVGTGSILAEAVVAAQRLREQGIFVDVYSITKITPFSSTNISSLFHYRQILTIEEHVAAGGLGEMLRMQLPSNVNVKALSVSDSLCSSVGSQTWLRAQANLASEGISKTVTELLSNDRR
jgi:transketolase